MLSNWAPEASSEMYTLHVLHVVNAQAVLSHSTNSSSQVTGEGIHKVKSYRL